LGSIREDLRLPKICCRDGSSTIEDLFIVALGDTWELLIEAFKTTQAHVTQLQRTRGLVVRTSLDLPSGRIMQINGAGYREYSYM
jgi:hypothetical protein